ncbi:MAG: hypothetical protein JXA08_06470 [Methanomicrobiaceae archaeon]|nr:hypothetical protein [Methanomicrobiaceae archaeon]
MTEARARELPVEGGTVQCTPARREEVVKCRFCAHSSHFMVRGRWVGSPARAYCTRERTTTDVDLKKVTVVECDDQRSEGYRSIMNIIS